jgi:hypothetical protein
MYTQQEITSCLLESSRGVADQVTGMSPELFHQPALEGKWTPAQHLEHLYLSIKPLNKALGLPRFMLRIFGRPNREGRTYEALTKRYQERLAEGGRATGRFIPGKQTADKDNLVEKYRRESEKLVSKVARMSEAELDAYLLPHPLLGKLSLREMLFFTIYHTYHHQKQMKKAPVVSFKSAWFNSGNLEAAPLEEVI